MKPPQRISCVDVGDRVPTAELGSSTSPEADHTNVVLDQLFNGKLSYHYGSGNIFFGRSKRHGGGVAAPPPAGDGLE